MKFRLGTKHKVLFVSFGALLSVFMLILFCFKLPNVDDYGGILPSKEPNFLPIENGKRYEQTFRSDVNHLQEASVLMLRKNSSKITGTVYLAIYDANHTKLFQQSYEADMIPNMNLLANIGKDQGETLGKEFTISLRAEGLNNSNLGLAITKENKDKNKMQIDGMKSKDKSLVISYKGKKGDKSMFWYPLMILALLIPLTATINDKELRKGKHNEK